jgi:hypothetical protein
MFGKKNTSMLGNMDVDDMRDVARTVIAGLIVYKAAKYVVKELLD